MLPKFKPGDLFRVKTNSDYDTYGIILYNTDGYAWKWIDKRSIHIQKLSLYDVCESNWELVNAS